MTAHAHRHRRDATEGTLRTAFLRTIMVLAVQL